MNNSDVCCLIDNFLKVAELAGIHPDQLDIKLEILELPHTPRRLPNGKMAVYVFCYKDRTLKIGKAGPKSNARYTSQHYNPRSAPSTLSASLLQYQDRLNLAAEFDSETVGDWIKQNTQRINFILNAECGINVLTLLESFLQCCLNPEFEGFSGQK